MSPFVNVTFLTCWATDQILGIIIPLKDLNYTICYAINVI